MPLASGTPQRCTHRGGVVAHTIVMQQLTAPAAVPTHLPRKAVPALLVERHDLLPAQLQPLAAHVQGHAWRAPVRPPAKLLAQHLGCGEGKGEGRGKGVRESAAADSLFKPLNVDSGNTRVHTPCAWAIMSKPPVLGCPQTATHAGWS